MGTAGGACCVPASFLANPTHSKIIAPANSWRSAFKRDDERLTSQSILLFKTKRHEPDWPRERLRAESRCHFEKDDEPTCIIIRAR